MTRRMIAFSRTDKASKIVQEVLAGTNCLECKSCCRTRGIHRTPVGGTDPHHEDIRKLAKNKFPEAIHPEINDGFDILSPESCAFLKDDRCSIYAIRPVICSVFPFIPQSVTSYSDSNGFTTGLKVVLTSCCPPLRQLSDEGVQYLTLHDLHQLSDRTFLTRSFYTVLFYMERGIVFQSVRFISKSGDLAFPIL
ncbi:YkgJ family cysteine cluster protein [Candidatus Micrarchaeota archaeon]|nr:YkgJ family cysteine cluster protein [Candidatus Micrarchaeota archaeon]